MSFCCVRWVTGCGRDDAEPTYADVSLCGDQKHDVGYGNGGSRQVEQRAYAFGARLPAHAEGDRGRSSVGEQVEEGGQHVRKEKDPM
jgi:hypothetical protein